MEGNNNPPSVSQVYPSRWNNNPSPIGRGHHNGTEIIIDLLLLPIAMVIASTAADDEECASARGKTDISRMLANPHRALRTTRQSDTRTTALIFRVFVRSEGELYEVSISM